ncbi:MAG: trigger factor [Planctomycetota bacterium]
MNTETETPAEEQTPEMNLNVDVEETSACQRKVTVTIPREEIERYFKDKFDDLVPKAEVPGFRHGRAPRELVEKKFRAQVADQVKGTLLMDSLAQVSDNQDFSAISEPDLDYEEVTIPEDGDMTYTFTIEVRPEFDMPEWKGLSLERPEHEFTDDDIDQHIGKLALRFSELAPVDEQVAAEDYIVCNITSRHDGKVVSSDEEVTVQVMPTLSMADASIEGFDKLIVGAAAEETKTTNVTVSEFAENEELQGQEVEVSFEILDVKRVEAMSSDDVASKLGIESTGDLRELIKTSMEERLHYSQREMIREQISTLLTESANWELPQDLLKRQSGRELERKKIEMRSSGFSEQEIISRENGLRTNILEKTEILLKEHFILERIAEDESIEDEPQDYDMEIMRIAAQRNDSPRRVRARLERTGQMDALRNMIIERKVIDLITENASFKALPYETDEQSDSSAVNFFVAGGTTQIPEAKYDDDGSANAPTGAVKETD